RRDVAGKAAQVQRRTENGGVAGCRYAERGTVGNRIRTRLAYVANQLQDTPTDRGGTGIRIVAQKRQHAAADLGKAEGAPTHAVSDQAGETRTRVVVAGRQDAGIGVGVFDRSRACDRADRDVIAADPQSALRIDNIGRTGAQGQSGPSLKDAAV